MWRYGQVASTWFALGLLAGLILAFASCSPTANDLYVQPAHTQGVNRGAGQ